LLALRIASESRKTQFSSGFEAAQRLMTARLGPRALPGMPGFRRLVVATDLYIGLMEDGSVGPPLE
jgi:hypothetical protein